MSDSIKRNPAVNGGSINSTLLARKINERRQRPSPVMMTGEIISMLGSDGLQEALQRKWLVPDLDTGYLMVNMNSGKLSEVEEACKCAECHKCDCKCESLADVTFSTATAMPASMREAWAAPGVGGGNNPGGSSMQGQTPMMQHVQPIAPTTPPPKKPQVGNQVAAVEMNNGKEHLYQGKVSGIGQDGRYHIDFGTGEQPAGRRDYGPEELRFLDPANA